MRTHDSTIKAKYFHAQTRPSLSLHTRLFKNKNRDHSKEYIKRNVEQITLCILYKKKKIQFAVRVHTSFQELNKLLYQELYEHILLETQNNNQKAQKLIKTVVGFQSVDGDVNFDYRLSLQKGYVEKTKFFYPLLKKQNQSDIFKYKIYNCLAIGGFSKVYLARSLENGQFYVIKFIKKFNPNSTELQDKDKFQSMKNQVEVCNDLDHPFLIKMHHAFETQHFYCMVFDYCPGGQLFFLLKKVKIMNEVMARFYFLQILYGIQYLHSKNTIYRDLKPQNILIDADGNCKIVDFGLSKRIDSRTKTYSYCGSAQYMAPEMILRTGHSFGIDYYSLGAFLYELVTGLPPYYTKNHEQLQQSIICKEITFPQHIELSPEIKDLLQKLLKKQEKYRLGSYIGVKEILFHPWIGKVKSAQIIGKFIKSPFVPDLQEYNFDNSQLGEDEQQFTALVYEEANKKVCILKQYIKNNMPNGQLNKTINEIMRIQNDCSKENIAEQKGQITKKDKSKQKFKQLLQPYRSNILDKLDKSQSKQKSIRINNIVDERRTRQICKLSPYLNYKQASPKKQKELMEFVQNRIIRMEKAPPHKALKRMKIQKNKMVIQKA